MGLRISNFFNSFHEDQATHYVIDLSPDNLKTNLWKNTIHRHSLSEAGPPKHWMQKRRVWDEEVWDRAYMQENEEKNQYDDGGGGGRRPYKWCWCRDGDGGREGCQFVKFQGVQLEAATVIEEEKDTVKVINKVTVIERDNPPAQSKLWRPWEDFPSSEAAAGKGASCEAAAGEGVSCEAPAVIPAVNIYKKVVFHQEVPSCEGQVSCEATADVWHTVSSSLSDVPVTPPVLETPRKPWAGGGHPRGGGEGGKSLRRFWYWRPWAGGGASPRKGGQSPRSGGRGLRRLLAFQEDLVRDEGAPPTGLQRRLQFGEGRGGGGGREGGPWGAATPVTPCQGGLSASTKPNLSLHNPLTQGGWLGHTSPSGHYLCHTCHTWGELWPMVQ